MPTTTELVSLPDTANHHDHDYHQLVFGLHGATEFDIQGRGARVGLGKGCLVPACTEHAFCGKGDNQILVINVPAAASHTLPALFDRADYFTLDSQRQVLLQAISREIAAAPLHSPMRQLGGQTLLLALHNVLSAPVPIRCAALDMEAIDHYIQLNLHRRLSVQELSSVALLSPSHFHARFKACTQYTPHQYVLLKRLAASQQKLAAGVSIIDTAQQCGFANQSAFTHAFRRHYGVTPAQSRRRIH